MIKKKKLAKCMCIVRSSMKLTAQETDLIGTGCRRRNVLPFLTGEKATEFVLIACNSREYS